MTILGVDFGMGAFKLYGEAGKSQTVSQVSLANVQRVGGLMGLSSSRRPPMVSTQHGDFYVGAEAHDYGKPIETFDYERLTGTPDMAALLYGSLSNHTALTGESLSDLSLVIGLPIRVLSGDGEEKNREIIKQWLKGRHTWQCDGQVFDVNIQDARIGAQPVGAFFDYVLDDSGSPRDRSVFKSEIGVVSIGFNTVELIVIRDRKPVDRFSDGKTIGVRRLLELCNRDNLYSMGELDMMLRSGSLNYDNVVKIWEQQVISHIEEVWDSSYRRFSAILAVGGGAVILKKALVKRFGKLMLVPSDPVQAISRGLYKMGLADSKLKK